MSTMVGLIIGVITFGGLIAGDVILVRYLIGLIPNDVGNWSALITAGIIFVDIWVLAGFIFALSMAVGAIAGAITHLVTGK